MDARLYSDRIAIAANQNVKEKEYWLKQLSGEPEKSYFPPGRSGIKDHTSRAHPVGGTPKKVDFARETETFEFPGDLVLKLEKISGGIDIKLHMVLTAGLVLLLQKYTGNRDILTGAPVLKQERDTDFINRALVFRNRVDDNMSFKDLLLQVRETIIRASENQNFPIEVLPGLLNIPVFENEFPLFDVALVLENIHDKNYLGNIHYNMLFSFLRSAGTIKGALEYNARLYERETIRGIIKHFTTLLGIVLVDIDIRLSTVDMLSEEKRKEILVGFNNTDMEYPGDKTIHELFKEQVARTPGKTAVVGMVHLTYRELDRAANRLAGILVKKGVKPCSIAAILIDPSVEMMIGIWGVLKAGAAYLPIDPASPPERVGFMLTDSSARLLLTSRSLNKEVNELMSSGVDELVSSGVEKLRSLEVESIFLDEIRSDTPWRVSSSGISDNQGRGEPLCSPNEDIGIPAGFPSPGGVPSSPMNPAGRGGLETAASPENLVYVIYTSGTTGYPKGVLVEHKNVAANIFAFYREFAIEEGDTVLQQSTFAFDVFVEEVFPVLLRGGKVAIPSRSEVVNIDLLSAFILKYKVNIIDCTPLLLNELNKLNNLDCVTTVISGGDVLKKEYIDNFLKSRKVYNTYGPTETTVCATYYRCSRQLNENIPIGKPIKNYKVFILDRNNRLQPIGAPGELCVAGAGVTRGYLNRPELTAEKFMGAERIGAKLYRTGDLARWLPDGNIEFLGRVDYQVKVRGYRIELGEIESRLLEHPGIEEAVVVEKNEESGDKYLCGYFISEKILDPADLRDYLGQKLPDYMVPWFFVQLEKMPLTPNGKIDRKALPEPGSSGEKEYVAPRDKTEEGLVEVWHQVLRVDKKEIGIDSNFFDLGGNSLKAIVISTRIHKTFEKKVLLVDIFKLQTIRKLADYMKDAQEEQFITIDAAEEKEYYRLSSAQERLYILQQLELAGTGYNMPFSGILAGELDKEKLAAAFRKLIKRHEILSTSFMVVQGEIMQRVLDDVRFNLEYYEAGEEEEARKIVEEFIKPFDLSRAPLLRAGLIRTVGPLRGSHPQGRIPGDIHILMVDMHHIVSDGVSQGILIRDFIALYEGRELQEIKIQYKDYSEWQRVRNLKEIRKIKEQEEYWLKEFTGEIPVLNLPADYTRPVLQSFDGSEVSFAVAGKELDALNKMALAAEATLYMVLFAIFNVLLSKLSSQEDIVIGVPTAGRRHADLEQVIGLFINTLALRNYPAGGKLFKGFLQEVKEKTLKAFENQEYQYEDLVEKAAVNRDTGRNPLFDVMFNLQNVAVGPGNLPEARIEKRGLMLKPFDYERKTAKFDLSVTAWEFAGELRFTLEYCTKIYKKETIERFISYFLEIISTVIVNPGIEISAVEIISNKEKRKILYEFNDTKVDYPVDKTIHRLFEEQVKMTPGTIALLGPFLKRGMVEQLTGETNSTLTYRELEKKANQLAKKLREKGVKQDRVVGLIVDRSLEMIIGLLGILKAGGAYLPIGPEYPAERVKYMLEHSGAGIVLTNYVGNYSDFKGTIIDLNSVKYYKDQISDLPPVSAPSDLAYVIYTSGTTGTPKGVMIENRQVVNFIKGITDIIPFDKKDTILCLTTLSFDIFGLETLLPLTKGARVVIGSTEEQLNAAAAASVIEREKVTIFQVTPSRLQMFISRAKAAKSLERLNYLLVGGEAFPGRLLERTREFSKGKIYNMYGPTETTIWSTVKDLSAEEPLNIGKPIANTRIYILGEKGNLQPMRVPGELCIAGEGLARGYYKNEKLTEEKFVRTVISHSSLVISSSEKLSKPTNDISNKLSPNDQCPMTNDRLYRTGDLASWLPDGNIEFLGRMDHQVKIRGFRIELEEIEKYLQDHENIKEAVVFTEEQDEDKYLCAYIAAAGELDVSGLRDYLSRDLPDYMIPSYFVQIDKIPLTPNGKVDRNALPKHKGKRLKVGTTYVAPSPGIEKIVADLWKEVLDLDKVGIHDNFFELGGNSMNIIQLNSKLKDTLKKEIPVAAMFRYLTIGSFTTYLAEAGKGSGRSGSSEEKQKRIEALKRSRKIYENTIKQFRQEVKNGK